MRGQMIAMRTTVTAQPLVEAISRTKDRPVIREIRTASIRVGPRMRPLGDVDALAESIREVGLLNPIVVTSRGVLVSGLHRLEAFRKLGKPTIPAVVLNISPLEAQLREIDENLVRNDLTLLERAEHFCRRKELYERLHPETRRGGDHGNQYCGGRKRQTDNLSFSHSVGKLTGRSGKTVQRLVRIGKFLTAETRRLLRGTEWADNQRTLMKLCQLPPDMQEQVARKASIGESREIYDAISRVHRDRLRDRTCCTPQEGNGYRLLRGDFRKVGYEISSGSVDLILTDAPYEARYLDVFEPLSLFAARVLREGGSLVVMTGQSYLPEVLRGLETHLAYQWVIASLLGPRRLLVKNRRVCVAYKPMLWFVKGRYRGHAIQDVIRSGGPDKVFHQHGQPETEFAAVIKHLTDENSAVLDPFVGGGNVAAAAIRLGRKFIGLDIDRKQIEVTKRRISSLLHP